MQQMVTLNDQSQIESIRKNTEAMDFSNNPLVPIVPLNSCQPSLPPTNQQNSAIQSDYRRIGGSSSSVWNSFYLISCLITTLLFFILLNIVLTFWIVTSLNLHNNGFGFRHVQPNKLSDHIHQHLGNIEMDSVRYQTNENLIINSPHRLVTEQMVGMDHSQPLVLQSSDTDQIVWQSASSAGSANNSITFSE